MTDTRVATDAGHAFSRRLGGFNIVDNVLVAFAAGVFNNAPAAVLHPDRFVEFVGGERQRMEKSVVRFREIFRNESRRRVTVVASRH